MVLDQGGASPCASTTAWTCVSQSAVDCTIRCKDSSGSRTLTCVFNKGTFDCVCSVAVECTASFSHWDAGSSTGVFCFSVCLPALMDPRLGCCRK